MSTVKYNDIASRLDQAYIKSVGEEIHTKLAEGEVVALCYEPGDMTRYQLLFTPVSALHQIPGGAFVPVGIWPDRFSYTLVSEIHDHHPFCYPFNLSVGRGELHPSYVHEKVGKHNVASTCAYTALFRAIAGLPILDEEDKESHVETS